MNNNNNGDEDEYDADEQQQVEQQQAEAAEAAAAAVAETQKEERMDMIAVVLKRRKKVPKRTKNKIDMLVEKFLQDLGDDIHSMLRYNDYPYSDNYRGLDSNRDTVAEVETAIRLFPEVLSRRRDSDDNDDDIYVDSSDEDEEDVMSMYPIQCLSANGISYRFNIRNRSFLIVFARLAIEFGSFEEELRGGLLIEDEEGRNVLDCLVSGCTPSTQHDFIDNFYLNEIKKLKEIGLMVKEDIIRYELLTKLSPMNHTYFAKERFRFLVEWDPTALMHTNQLKLVPLHLAANAWQTQAFRVTFEAGIRFFPKKKGISILFYKDHDDETPFQYACKKFGREKVVKVIEDTLTYYHSDTPINTAEALLLAAIDENIHLDCVYFLLRRQPDILQKLPSSSSSSSSSSNDIKNNYNGNIVESTDILISETKISSNKRKRNDMKNDDDDKGT